MGTKPHPLSIRIIHDLKDILNQFHPYLYFVRFMSSFKDWRIIPLELSQSTKLIFLLVATIDVRLLPDRTIQHYQFLGNSIVIPSCNHHPKIPNNQKTKNPHQTNSTDCIIYTYQIQKETNILITWSTGRPCSDTTNVTPS
ncbi:unnamed protein product [Vicia faba]|uniref:Uncharacterized protein n=1 Tax=Vicia faba TaxID=3906 RepID=A0AAV0ZS84_VICFA|nr:unnamed protein product [Vicia faba]